MCRVGVQLPPPPSLPPGPAVRQCPPRRFFAFLPCLLPRRKETPRVTTPAAVELGALELRLLVGLWTGVSLVLSCPPLLPLPLARQEWEDPRRPLAVSHFLVVAPQSAF
jgi:hypothetical protein